MGSEGRRRRWGTPTMALHIHIQRRDLDSHMTDSYMRFESVYDSIERRLIMRVGTIPGPPQYESTRSAKAARSPGTRSLRSAYVSICQHMSAYVSMCQHMSAYISICQQFADSFALEARARAAFADRVAPFQVSIKF